MAESSDRSGWAGTCLCTNEVQGKGLVPTRKSAPLQAVIFREEVLVIARRGRSACTRAAKGRPYGAPSNFAVIARAVRPVVICPPTVSLRGAKRRGNLKAPMDGKLRLNGTSQRLPRPLRGLAMTSFGVASGGVWRAFA